MKTILSVFAGIILAVSTLTAAHASEHRRYNHHNEQNEHHISRNQHERYERHEIKYERHHDYDLNRRYSQRHDSSQHRIHEKNEHERAFFPRRHH
jgi:hypothetical protein